MYSQNDEEQIILEVMSRRGIGGGRLLDIGAFDGKTFSNSLALIERGWTGVCVEPTFQAFRALAEVHKLHAGIELVNALVEPLEDYRKNGLGLRRFWASPDAVATSDPAHMEKWKSLGQFQQIWVPAINLIQLSETFKGPFDFVNIDCEGAATIGLFRDMAIPGAVHHRSFFRASCVCVEFEGAQKDMMVTQAAACGLKLIHTTSENLIFERA